MMQRYIMTPASILDPASSRGVHERHARFHTEAFHYTIHLRVDLTTSYPVCHINDNISTSCLRHINLRTFPARLTCFYSLTKMQIPLSVVLAPLAAQAVNIVLSNDDGWAEKNIRVFYDTLTSAGESVIISAPADNRSGTGSSDATPGTVTSGCEFNSCPAGSPPYGSDSSNPRFNYVNSYPVTSIRYGIQTLSPKFFGGAPDIAVAGYNVGGKNPFFFPQPPLILIIQQQTSAPQPSSPAPSAQQPKPRSRASQRSPSAAPRARRCPTPPPRRPTRPSTPSSPPTSPPRSSTPGSRTCPAESGSTSTTRP